MSEAAIDHVQHKFAIHEVANHYIDLLKTIVEHAKGEFGEVNFP
jgi:hypothetical protein